MNVFEKLIRKILWVIDPEYMRAVEFIEFQNSVMKTAKELGFKVNE